MRIFYKVIFIVCLLAGSASISSGAANDDLKGKWRLMYKNNYGYEFQFLDNYRTFCIIYNNTNALIFKGIYSIDGDRLTININAMKSEENIHAIDLWRKFAKTSSSYFIFRIKLTGKDAMTLVVMPLKTIIDGNDTSGYFEPEISLKRF